MTWYALTMSLVTAVSAQLDPQNSLYCNMHPEDFTIPVIQPQGLQLQQLQVSCGDSSVSQVLSIDYNFVSIVQYQFTIIVISRCSSATATAPARVPLAPVGLKTTQSECVWHDAPCFEDTVSRCGPPVKRSHKFRDTSLPPLVLSSLPPPSLPRYSCDLDVALATSPSVNVSTTTTTDWPGRVYRKEVGQRVVWKYEYCTPDSHTLT